MSSEDDPHSMTVIETVAATLDRDPTDLPPLEETISADALDSLFHEGAEPDGAYTIFPYAGVWVLVHSTGTVDVFDEFRATSQPNIHDPSDDERILVLHAKDNQYALTGGELNEVHTIIEEADDSDEAWYDTIEYAKRAADD